MIRSEKTALWVSALAALGIGVVALAAAALSNSNAILLDGLYNVAYFVTALLTLRVAGLLQRPDDERFPFGYMYFEPLINTAKGLLILGVNIFAIYEAVLALFTGGRPVEIGPAIIYAVLGTTACSTVWLLLRNARCRKTSPLIQADIGNWLVNSLISGGVLAGFCFAWVLQQFNMTTAANYVDPIMVAAVVLVSLGVPIRMAGRGITALLHRAPPESVTVPVRVAVEAALASLPARKLYVRTVQPGRTTYVTVHALLGEAEAGLDLRRADGYRKAVVAALVPHHAPVIVDIVFTTVEEFAAPGTVYTLADARPLHPGQQ